MPLKRGSSRQVIGSNISELEASGHPRAQSIAIALSTADRARKDSTMAAADSTRSKLDTNMERARIAGGGIVPNANAKAAEGVAFGNPVQQLSSLFNSAKEMLRGRKSVTGGSISPTTQKDVGH